MQSSRCRGRNLGGKLLLAVAVVFGCVLVFAPNGHAISSSVDDLLDADLTVDRHRSGTLSKGKFTMKPAADGSPLFSRSGDGDRSMRASRGICNDGWDDRFAGGGGANDYIRAVTSDGAGNIYVGGDFTMIGGIAANHIAKWDGSNWSALGSGMNDSVISLEMSGTDLYAGGYFTTADGNTNARRVAKWNGTSWSPLGTGLQGNVFYDMTVVGSTVYVSGYGLLFTPLEFMVLKWDGAVWTRVGGRFIGMPWTMASSGSDVYVGGNFTDINGVPVNRLAKMNGNTWVPVGGGVNGYIRDMQISGSDLYIAGEFTMVGTTAADRIAKWSGTTWSPLGSGMEARVTGLSVSGANVYAGGQFTTAGGATVNYIAKWNGVTWSSLGTGTNSGLTPPNVGGVGVIAVSGTDVYAGGYFTTAGCRDSMRFGRYFQQRFIGTTLTGIGGANDWFNAANWSSGVVPAADSDATIESADASISSVDVTVRDLRIDEGRTVTVAAGRTLTVTRNLNLLGSITGPGTVVVSNCAASAVSRDAAATGSIRTTLVRCVAGAGTFNFPVGTASGYSPVQLNNVTGTGSVSILANEGAYAAAATGLPANRLARWWQIENPGGGITETDLAFNYQEADINGVETDYRAYRISGGTASQMWGSIDTTANTVTATDVTQFSDWTLAQAPPTSAAVSVSGRVSTADGRGIRNAVLTLTASDGTTRVARTGSFGYYAFDGVASGETYVLTIATKRYSFSALSRLISVNESIGDVDFTALQE